MKPGAPKRYAMLVALVLLACSGEPADPEAAYQRELAAAKDAARASLAAFWDRFATPEEGDYDFSLKAALPRRDGKSGVEEAWVENVARSPSKIVGELSAQPLYLGDLKEGAIVEFQESQIVDWAFMGGDRLFGHFTTRVMLPKMDGEQAGWLRPLLSETPAPEARQQ
ncbi:MAG: hypothetical protein RIR33_336 [Pseudomonadota bacterium]